MAKKNISPYEVILQALKIIDISLEEIKVQHEETSTVKVRIIEP